MGYSLTNIQKTTVILLSIYVAVGFCQSFDSSSRTLILGGSSNEKSYMFYNETTIIIHSVDVSTLYTNLFDRNSLASVSSQIQTTLSVNTYKTSTVVEESGVTYGYFVMVRNPFFRELSFYSMTKLGLLLLSLKSLYSLN